MKEKELLVGWFQDITTVLMKRFSFEASKIYVNCIELLDENTVVNFNG